MSRRVGFTHLVTDTSPKTTQDTKLRGESLADNTTCTLPYTKDSEHLAHELCKAHKNHLLDPAKATAGGTQNSINLYQANF